MPAPRPEDMLLRLEGVGLDYRIGARAVPAIRDATISIARGEMVAILGPSGSGKSTLLYVLGCLLKPSRGRYWLAGHDVGALPNWRVAALRSRAIGFVFQQFHLLPRADLIENCLLSAKYLGDDPRSEAELRAKAKGLLESLGLGEHLEHRPNQLSGGQQQRAAIARALMNDPELILADEPTGNLDSASAGRILDELDRIHRSGRTVLIITHDRDVAGRCQRVIAIRDGVAEASAPAHASNKLNLSINEPGRVAAPLARRSAFAIAHERVATARANLSRNKTRSALTMLGVTIGTAAVLATITLGSHVRSKILESYETLGVNKLVVRAYPRWNMQARDVTGVKFDGLSELTDVKPMTRLFPEITLISPVIQDAVLSAEWSGHKADQTQVLGVKPEYFAITSRRLESGRYFSAYHERNRSRVCLIGSDVVRRLFGKTPPLQRVVQINGQADNRYSCLVIGSFAPVKSNSEWSNPNLQVVMPYSFLKAMALRDLAKPFELNMQMRPGASVENLGRKVERFIENKYGRSVDVHADSDELLVAQMRKFLTLFALLLSAVAFMSLAVGGIGITNMMLASVTERFKEIGLRKALGASDREIRGQFLAESLLLCALAGLAGVACGVAGYESLLWLAAQLSPKVTFEWILNPWALLLATASIFVVGVGSGLAPALRAERLEVVEALRSE